MTEVKKIFSGGYTSPTPSLYWRGSHRRRFSAFNWWKEKISVLMQVKTDQVCIHRCQTRKHLRRRRLPAGGLFPYYRVIMDPSVIDAKVFARDLDSLCLGLSRVLKDQPPSYYKEKILQARRTESKYLVLHKRQPFLNTMNCKTARFFRLGRNREVSTKKRSR